MLNNKNVLSTNTTVSWELISATISVHRLVRATFCKFLFQSVAGNDPSSGKAASKENQRVQAERFSLFLVF